MRHILASVPAGASPFPRDNREKPQANFLERFCEWDFGARTSWRANLSQPLCFLHRGALVPASDLQTLAPQTEAMTAPVENLEAVGLTIAKNEQVARERVADEGEKAIEPQTQAAGGNDCSTRCVPRKAVSIPLSSVSISQ